VPLTHATTLNESYILYYVDLMTLLYISLLPLIALVTIFTPRPRIVLFLYVITDSRNLNEGVPLSIGCRSAGPHATTKSAYYTTQHTRA